MLRANQFCYFCTILVAASFMVACGQSEQIAEGPAGAGAGGLPAAGGSAGTSNSGGNSSKDAEAPLDAAGGNQQTDAGSEEDPFGELVPPIWASVTPPNRDIKGCEFFIGKPELLPWPKPNWENQGLYESLEAVPPTKGDWFRKGSQRAWTIARHQVGGTDELYIHMKHSGRKPGDIITGINRIVRIRDFKTIATFAQRYTHPSAALCSEGNYRESALDILYSSELFDSFITRFNPVENKWTLAPKAPEFIGTHGLDQDEPWNVFVTNSNQVKKMDLSTGNPILVRQQSAARYPASLGNTLVWTENSEVWAIQASEEPQKWISGIPKRPCGIGITPEWIFGAGEEENLTGCSNTTSPTRLWKAKRGLDGKPASTPELGPNIEAQYFGSHAKGWGDYVGFGTNIDGIFELFIVNLGSWKTWQLNRNGIDISNSVWAIDNNYLYTAVFESNLMVTEFRRYPLSNLDQVATIIYSGEE